MSLSDVIKAEARRLGFQFSGITTPEPPPHFNVFEDWLASGRHAQMGYLATERSRKRRADPRQILPECRSILVLGMRYADPHRVTVTPDEPAAGGPRGRIAAYAWGDDYHDVLPERLQALVAFIEDQVGKPVPSRWYTDTGPILERDLAQRAGLGWTGKNTLLINPDQGSYFLLAEILLGIDLDPDPPFSADLCGSCTRCLEACPTACILPDRTLDAGRCISYLTIELKGAIPVEMRPQTGEWIFGCDICQEVCPWNIRFSTPEHEPAFASRPEAARPGLQQELRLTQEAFNRKFKGSPVKRAKRRGYLRNVAVALGNTGDASVVPDLIQALQQDPEPLVRAHAAWALGRLGGELARQALVEAEKTEVEPEVLEEIRACLYE